MNRLTWLVLAGALAFAGAATAAPGAQAAPATPQGATRLTIVQAVPGQHLDVAIDDRGVADGSATGTVLGPFDLPAGAHDVTFRDASGAVVVDTSVELTGGAAQDLVVHLPAQVDGDPLATLYTTPTTPIGVDKARVLIAHTASVAPADVRLDGTVVFSNIANGEFATADVAQGDHVAELLPSGLTSRPILGPLDVSLAARTATMVYAVGTTDDDSMQVVSHTVALTSDGMVAPTSIDAGSAGLAADIDVTPFAATGPTTGSQAMTSGGWLAVGLVGMASLLACVVISRRRSRPVEVVAQ